MSEYINNIIIVFGSLDGGIDKVLSIVKELWGVEVEHVSIYDENIKYDGEVRCNHNTLVYVDVLIPLKRDFYSVDEISKHIPLKAVGMPQEAVDRADLILVVGTDETDNWIYPYSNRLMKSSEDF